jgi:ATP-dependent helicase/nuclease subunit B
MALALYRAMDGTLLTPEIRPLGDLEEEDGLSAFGPDALELPPALSSAARRGALAKLVQGWREAQREPPLPPASLLAAADELCTLMDQAALVGGVDWNSLSDLATELSPQLAEHWQVSVRFLDIVMRAWPEHLRELGSVDEQTRRLLAAQALSDRWSEKPPQRPVIIAGSTGAGEATRILMLATLRLSRGVVVLPGLDPDMTTRAWKSVADAASHPQHVLGQTLQTLGLRPEQVRPWPGVEISPEAQARRKLVNEALAPAEETRDWTRRLDELASPSPAEVLVSQALDGLSLVEAEDEGEEALAAALLLRETLETPGKTAALVTPEASLARRVAAVLERWGVDIGPSAGVPLHRTQVGGFLLLVARWAADPADPVRLLTVLKHGLTRVGRSPQELQRLVSWIERQKLRGPRLDATLGDLAGRLTGPEAELIGDLEVMQRPANAVMSGNTVDGAAAIRAIAEVAQSIAGGDHIWSKREGQMAGQFVDQLSDLSNAMGPIATYAFTDFAESLMSRMIAAPDAPEHPRIVIWGPLEARLQRRDRVILASLNEGSWPRPASADAFLNRRMRQKLGLPDPDERVGLSAHDFAQFANAPEVILLRARRVEDKPAVASRWLWRLRTLAAGGLGRDGAEAALRPKPGADPLVWARALRHADQTTPAKPPQPKPPADKRNLLKFSPTRATNLIRDPYADYGAEVLRLKRLRRVGEEIDPRERGSAVHKAIELHEDEANEKALGDLIEQRLLAAGASPEITRLEKPLWERAVRVYLAWAAARQGRVADKDLEKEAIVMLKTAAGDVRLKAKADRVELLRDGTLAIIDFKTGAPKSARQVKSGLEPQLPLEAAIAARTPFGKVGPAKASELIYFQLSTSAAVLKDKNGEALDLKTPVADVAEEALAGLVKMIEAYANPAQPYLSRPRVFSVRVQSDFDRLARRAEWTIEEGEE